MTDAPENVAYANYDLRAEDPTARKPSIRFAFEFPELLAKFEPADKTALVARGRSRILGMFAIGLVLIALLLASGELLLAGPDREAFAPLGYIAGTLGLIGTALGLIGSSKSSPRRRWLHCRLQTETLRLFHFHFIASRLPEIIEASTREDMQENYIRVRHAALERLQATLADPHAELDRIVKRSGEIDFVNLAPALEVESDDIPEVAADIFSVWRRLRLDWQHGYCEAKLAHDSSAGWTPRRQEHAFNVFGWICLAIIIVFHLTHFGHELMHLPAVVIEVGVTWTALSALAGRALEDGLQPQREVERYEQYRANVRVSTERFESARGLGAKLEVMRTFERTSLEEMRVFLRTHAKSRFLL
jgi:hypothetical protein